MSQMYPFENAEIFELNFTSLKLWTYLQYPYLFSVNVHIVF